MFNKQEEKILINIINIPIFLKYLWQKKMYYLGIRQRTNYQKYFIMEQSKKESINNMNCSISSIYYCPVKTLSFQSIKYCNVKKEQGMINDRIFAFSRGVDLEKAKSMEKNPNDLIHLKDNV